jgi:hypothetical protein
MPLHQLPVGGPRRRIVARGLAGLVAVLVVAGCASSSAVRGRVPKPTGHGLVTSSAAAAVSTPGPTSARTQGTVTAACPTGEVLLSGGLVADLTTGQAPNPSLRLVGSVPLPGGSGAADAQQWRATVAAGGVDQPDARTTAVALCAPSLRGARIVTTSAAGPRAAASAADATAACPSGWAVAGGGGAVSLASGAAGPPQYFLTGSYPSNAAGVPAPSDTAAAAWTAVGALGGMPMTNGLIRAVAICVPPSSGVVRVATVRELGPTKPRAAEEVTASCGPGTHLVGGGAYTGPPKLGHVLQGLHLRGSFPSGDGGAVPKTGTSVGSWSVIANAGGMVTIGARTTAFAMCTG